MVKGYTRRGEKVIYGGGFSYDKISKFSCPASSSRLRALTKVIVVIYRLRDVIYSATRNVIPFCHASA